MNKITTPNYYLPIVEALTALDEAKDSANKPILLIGVDQKTGEKGEYYVKLNAAERMQYGNAKCKELIAAFMAMELDLPVVPPAVVNISSEFVATTQGKPYFQVVSSSIGYNVASKNVLGMQTLSPSQKLYPKQLKLAPLVFAFDILIQNPDRTFDNGGKPNILTDGEQFVLLDHELAFGFSDPFVLGKNNTPWHINATDMRWIRNHILFKHIDHQSTNYNLILDKFSIFDAHFWKQIDNLVPHEWKTDITVSIKQHVDSMIENKSKFVQSLNQLI
ncbi:MAG: hypothetical protein EAY81_03785 [Bacteroidetes bacterium]|nr:MAG: hypothetical protein EAY81_03785 [Bacteroidota bacterium]